MPFRVDVLFSSPVPDDEMDRTDLIGKVLPDIRALGEQMQKVGLNVKLTVKTVNSVPGRPRSKAMEPYAHRSGTIKQEAAE
jgi:hypothetical protein